MEMFPIVCSLEPSVEKCFRDIYTHAKTHTFFCIKQVWEIWYQIQSDRFVFLFVFARHFRVFTRGIHFVIYKRD